MIVENGIIKDVGPKTKLKRRNLEILDFKDHIIAPGFIDIHIHGIAGGYTMDAKIESIEKMVKALALHGVTSFLPTLEPASIEVLKKALETIILAKEKNIGAKIAGINLEGPFLNIEKAGGVKKEYLRPPSIKEFDELYEFSHKTIKIITIAPELPKGIEFIRYASSLGIVVSIGHTNATYKEAIEAIKNGASHVTHLFNAMRGLHHREPGVIGAVLENPNVTVELICDLIHLHPSIIRLVYQIKPIESIITVTDSVFADMPEGIQKIWEWEIIIKNNMAILPDGTLVGSVLTLDKALRNLVFKIGIPIENALQTMTINPAKIIRLDKKIGSIEKGKLADFIVMDEKLNIKKTFINGKEFN
jgi:N-acetylglucosamine-6-phosphate deacetylase